MANNQTETSISTQNSISLQKRNSNSLQSQIKTQESSQTQNDSNVEIPLDEELPESLEVFDSESQPLDESFNENITQEEIGEDYVNPNIIAWGLTLYNYEATNDSELSFQQGEYVGIIEEGEDGWCTGELHGVEGLFPTSYIQKSTPSEEKKR